MKKKAFEPAVRVQILDQDSILQIHNAALEVLDRTGVAINTEDGRKILLEAGCKLTGDNVVHIPAKLVEKAIKSAPSSVTLYDRLGEERCVLEGWKTSFGTGSDCPFILDRQTQERRQCTYDDVAKGALVCDTLENFDFVMPVGIISDRPTDVADVYAVEATMSNTVKPVVFTAHNKKTFQASVDLAATVAGGHQKLAEKPTICLYDEPTSPLRHMPEATDKVVHAARMRIPVIFTPCPSMGATAPATAAGLLVQATAECLSGLVLHQLANAGAPIIFGGVMTVLDMSTTIYPYGAPELHQLCAALTDIAHHYELPMFGTCGCSDAKRVDAQAGMEVGFSTLMATLNGQNLIHDIGFLESALITSYEMYVLGDEAIGMAKHIAGGVAVNHDTLAVDVIDAVGQKGDYLTQDHTLKFFRKEFYFPRIMDRTNYAGWEKLGSKTLDVKLKEKVDEILATHKAESIAPAAVEQIKQILKDIQT
ncbi:MAG: trimethylamine methyltransferase family protein [Planctomycetota bacterium]|jgi:trimethylamine--corrinoid protein Co-methyltransferase